LCRKLGVTRQGYYAWKQRGKCRRQQDNERLLDKVVDIHKSSRETYGYPRVHAALKQQGEPCSRNRVARLMRDYGIQAKMARRFRKHSHRHHLIRAPKNLLLDRGPVTGANQVWVCDVTYIRVGKDWNYLCTVMDLYTRKVIGWQFARKLDTTVAREALLMALESYTPQAGAIFHTDQGVEFANKGLKAMLDAHNLLVSKSRKGCCWDNAKMESFYHTLKTEMVYFQSFRHLTEALAYIIDYIHFYNHDRLHSSLNYQSPSTYEAMTA
jgi:putative transposase